MRYVIRRAENLPTTRFFILDRKTDSVAGSVYGYRNPQDAIDALDALTREGR